MFDYIPEGGGKKDCNARIAIISSLGTKIPGSIQVPENLFQITA